MARRTSIRRSVFRVLAVLTGIVSSTIAADAPWKLNLGQTDPWYRSPEARTIAANVLSHQSDAGSWPKNVDTTARVFTGDRHRIQGTFDNGATFRELRFLGRMVAATQAVEYREAFLKGLDHVVRAQYPSGGWPQSFPPGQGYHRHITFNDGAMVNILEFLGEVAEAPQFAFVDQPRRNAAAAGFRAGIQCILKCQIIVEGNLTIWCAQHDEKTFEPRPGRTFEPASLTSAESAGILQLLMKRDHPSAEIERAIHAGARWFAESRIEGIRQTRVDGDKVIGEDKDAPALWSRFYELATNRPIFCGRDGVIKYDIAEIDAERRNGYAWYGSWGEGVAAGYARWRKKWDREQVPPERSP